ncbi:1900_t:CDS:2 [Paraglomus brasilianum]|uniref:1900_t:CDS:1 n=1 Tax=Paraglomus brasilianum TaxID=144538 RepID=A0A9N9GJU9_9GLOM|nr:1900_t:CDS:2 [Paraglomus brasilianum]
MPNGAAYLRPTPFTDEMPTFPQVNRGREEPSAYRFEALDNYVCAMASKNVPTNVIKIAIVEYDYVVRKRDEISLQKGSVVAVLEQNHEWWKGDLNGHIGTFQQTTLSLLARVISISQRNLRDKSTALTTVNRLTIIPPPNRRI